MAAVQSRMVPLGTKASDFNLRDAVSGKFYSLADIRSDIATVIMFICNHCPYVKLMQEHLSDFTRQYSKKGINFACINSNNYMAYTDDSPEKMKELARLYGWTFPYLIDETQEIAKAYQAECTPDFFVYNKNLELIYRGQYDFARPGNGIAPSGSHLAKALDCAIDGRVNTEQQIPSIGCNIKWK